MRNNHGISRREIVAGLAALPILPASTAIAAPHIRSSAIANWPGAASPISDQPSVRIPALDGSPDWPNASSTGIPAGMTLTNTGEFTSTSPGQLIEGLNVSGFIAVNHDGVTVRNCRAQQVLLNIKIAPQGPSNVTIDHCHVTGPLDGGESGVVLLFSNSATVTHCDISHVENGIWLEANNCLITDNYLHDLKGASTNPDPHIDGLQIERSASKVSNNLIRHNNFALARDVSSCIMIRDAMNIDIDNNRLNGGSYIVYFEGDTFGCNVTNNLFLKHAYGYIDGQASRRQTYKGNIFA